MKKLFVITVFMVSILFFPFSNARAIGTPTAVCPGLPYGQTEPYYSSRTPTFMWTPVEGATWYQIYLSYADSTGTALLKQWVRGDNSWTISAGFDLYPGEEYSWWVRAYDGSCGSWSNRADFTVGHLKIISVGPSSFNHVRPDYPGWLENRGGALQPSRDYSPDDTFSNFWNASIMVPDLARFEYLKLYFKNDGAVSSQTQCYLFRKPLDADGLYQIGGMFAPADTNLGDSVVDDNLSGAWSVVNNGLYTYFVQVYLPTVNNWLFGVEVAYWD